MENKKYTNYMALKYVSMQMIYNRKTSRMACTKKIISGLKTKFYEVIVFTVTLLYGVNDHE